MHLLIKPIRKLMWMKAICEKEGEILHQVNNAISKEESFLKQKAKVEWLRVGDRYSTYFHKVIHGGVLRNRVQAIMNQQGIIVEGNHVANIIVSHFTEFLGTKDGCVPIVESNCLFTKQVHANKVVAAIREVSDIEIKTAMFRIGDKKSPGSDGYSHVF
ncbi:uncharacterized protein [Rutidosis leptorrhynchoides]|uniref:uncharacterized protein n=1 Tax=Rutidosis leptorrhynchoides TaxID=125765 RepID=UPI003A99EF6F